VVASNVSDDSAEPVFVQAGVRSWVAAPVVLWDGAFAAVLYVCDGEPRDWRGDDVACLMDIAGGLGEELLALLGRDPSPPPPVVAPAPVVKEDADPWRQIFERSPVPMWVYDTETYRFLAVNDAAVREYGWSRAEFLTLSALDVRPRRDIAGFLAQHRGHPRAGSRFVRHRRKDGTELLVEPSAEPVHFEGRPARVTLLVNVTERLRVETALREVEERFQHLAANIDAVLFLCTPDLQRVDYVSPAAAARWGGLVDSRLPWFEDVHPGDRRRMVAALSRLGQAGIEEEYRVVRQEGGTRWIRTRTWPVRDGKGQVVLCAGIVEDVTTLKTTEIALQASEQKFRQIVETADEGIWTFDRSGRTTYANPRMADLLGVRTDAMNGRSFISFVEDESRMEAEALLRGAGRSELRLRRSDGGEVWASASASTIPDEAGLPAGVLVMITDVTEQKRLQRQLQHGQKLELIGQLAGGVAHDFNNLLTAIIGNIDLVAGALPIGDPALIDLREARDAADRAVSLTRQLLAVSRRQVLKPSRILLEDVVRDAQRMLVRVLGEDTLLTTSLSLEPRAVLADPGQMGQVLVNLVVNARDAMPDGGEVRVSTGFVVLDAVEAAARGRLPGPYVTMCVRDDGVGMDADTQGRIFEPFYTTKDASRGTGLGLAIVLGIVEQMEGFIEVSSVVGRGSSFTVFLPALVEDEPPVVVAAPARAMTLGGTETILVVEDERSVRVALRRTLERLGYRVHEAADGARALELCATLSAPLDLILSDVVLPGMRGPELCAELLRLRPGVRVLFMSGYSREAVAARGRLLPGTTFVEKPFGAEEIARAVRDAFGRPPPAG
jgi:PAS domain S-box-containing protein